MNQEEYTAELARLLEGVRRLDASIEEARGHGLLARAQWRSLKSQKLAAVFEVARLLKRMQDAPGVKFKIACEDAGLSFQYAYAHLWMLEEFGEAENVRAAGIASGGMAMKAAAEMRRARRAQMALA